MRAAGRTSGVHSASWLGVVRSAAVLPMHQRPLQPARRRVVRGSSRCRGLTVTGWATLFICKRGFCFSLIDPAPRGGEGVVERPYPALARIWTQGVPLFRLFWLPVATLLLDLRRCASGDRGGIRTVASQDTPPPRLGQDDAKVSKTEAERQEAMTRRPARADLLGITSRDQQIVGELKGLGDLSNDGSRLSTGRTSGPVGSFMSTRHSVIHLRTLPGLRARPRF
jgi:hypothetical protein